MEADDQRLLMASDAGYGFVCTFADLVSRNRAGKTLLTLPENAKVMTPMAIHSDDDMLLAITAAGRMLMFPVGDLPQLSKGKGNKIISIPSAQAASGEDRLARLYLLPPGSAITLYVGKRKLTLRSEELQNSAPSADVAARCCRVACNVSTALKSTPRRAPFPTTARPDSRQGNRRAARPRAGAIPVCFHIKPVYLGGSHNEVVMLVILRTLIVIIYSILVCVLGCIWCLFHREIRVTSLPSATCSARWRRCSA